MRELNIATGRSRTSVHWTNRTISWEDLCERLQNPVRGVEPLEEYLSLSKDEQSKLKDVGGFVGGQMNGPRRLKGSVLGRDLIALDMDNVPDGQTDEVVARVAALGCTYAVYSTRKHRTEAPRLRAVIPLDRTAGVDEFEAAARKVAEKIGMHYMDPSTFEPHRLMYWPSVCADGEYVFRQGGSEPLSVDGTLAEYVDWRNVFLWPHAPSENIERRDPNKKMEDPRGKGGTVGTFCRMFSISEAIDTFLPDLYAPSQYSEFSDAPVRYTYTKGTASNGAVVYDDDTFLFSNHSTDPLCGMEVNAFDMVRIHLYGKLDEKAKEDTEINKLPSYKKFEADLLERPDFKRQLAIDAGMSAADSDKIVEVQGGDEEKAEQLAEFIGRIKLDKMPLDTAMVRELLNILGITCRLNSITGRVEVSGYPQAWTLANAENLMPTNLLDLLRKANTRYASKGDVADRLDIISEENQYNPVIDMLNETKWDGADRVETLLSVWGIREHFDRVLVRKWLVQCIAMALNHEDDPIGAEGVLVLRGPQGVGKTSALRKLVPLRGMFREGSMVDPNNKDTIIQSTSCWVCELGELDRTTAKDAAGLKAFLTERTTRFRAPYARKEIIRPRRTSFCGSVNVKDYLADDTGNRRFWTIEVSDIDKQSLFSDWMNADWYRQLWAQIYVEMYLPNPGCFRLTDEEQTELMLRNGEYLRALDGELELRDLLNWDLPEDQWGEFSAAQVALLLKSTGANVAPRRVGRVLTKLEMSDLNEVSSRVLHGRRLYRLPLPKA